MASDTGKAPKAVTTNELNAPTKPRIKSVDELTQQNIDAIAQLDELARKQSNAGDRIADRITRFCGSMVFVWAHIIWYGVWIGMNLTLPEARRWDPFPFQFLTLVVSLEAIFLSAFILIAQNRQGYLSERRAQLDLQVNLLSEQENTKMLELLEAIACKVGVRADRDKEVKLMQEAILPEKLVEQIEKRVENKAASVAKADAEEKGAQAKT